MGNLKNKSKIIKINFPTPKIFELKKIIKLFLFKFKIKLKKTLIYYKNFIQFV